MRLMLIVLTAVFAAPVRASEKPNIIVVADDIGYADVGFQGCKDIPTPHLDSRPPARSLGGGNAARGQPSPRPPS